MITGDLFEHKEVDPYTFDLAAAGLRKLRDRRIPVFAIEGNHEKFLRHGARTWLWYLNREGLLNLLDVGHQTGEVSLDPWSSERRAGAYFDLDGIRIFGVGYYGARLPQIIEQLVEKARDLPAAGVRYSICMLHTGVDDKVDYNFSGATASDVLALAPLVDYVALGHVHHQFHLPDDPDERPQVFSPGALENWSVREVGRTKGLYDVRVDTDLPEKHDVRHVPDATFRRDYLRLRLDAGDCTTPDALRAKLGQLVASETKGAQRPLVEVKVVGALRFERALFDHAELERIVRDGLDCLFARVILEAQTPGLSERSTAGMARTRAEIEADVLRELIGRYDEFAPFAAGLSELAVTLKSRSLEGVSDEDIVDRLSAELERLGALADAGA